MTIPRAPLAGISALSLMLVAARLPVAVADPAVSWAEILTREVDVQLVQSDARTDDSSGTLPGGASGTFSIILPKIGVGSGTKVLRLVSSGGLDIE